jgi:hypothetical protein
MKDGDVAQRILHIGISEVKLSESPSTRLRLGAGLDTGGESFLRSW